MKIDILMATFNGEKYLREQIDSILKQSYTNFRLLISDDCSTDSTRSILNEYVGKDSRVIVFLQNKNLGVVKNFEYLMQKVESEYFMFSDQDDIWKQGKIQKSVDKIKETGCDLVYSDLEVVKENLETLNSSYWKLKGFDKKVKLNNFESLYLNNYITGSTMMVKSKWIEKILPLPNKSKYILHDYWTALIVSKYGKMKPICETLVKYRQHGNNEIGTKKKSETMDSIFEIRDLFIDVKLDHFKIFTKNKSVWDDDIIELNNKAYNYFKNLKNLNKPSFEELKLFWELYKCEKFGYKLKNFLIINFPNLTERLFKIRCVFKRNS